MQARAVSKYIRSSPKKMRIVANEVRGMKVESALSMLHYMPHTAAKSIERAIKDAVHNLIDQNQDERVLEDELVVSEIFVDAAPMFKRIRPAPRGRAHRIRKRSSHLTVVVGDPVAVVEETADAPEEQE